MVSTSILHANTIHVPDDEPTIQAGINACVDGDTVLVADGTYTRDGNRDIDFGGGAIVVMSENGPEVTIIDCEGSEAEPHRGFYFHSGEELSSIVQGFTITNGWANEGSGIRCYESSPKITNCTINDNTTRLFGEAAMYNYKSDPIVTNCTFSQNGGAYFGGGMHIHGSSPTITNCILWGDIPDEIFNWQGNLLVIYSDVQGGYTGERNIDADPLFASYHGADYLLHPPSPCIDAGDPALDDGVDWPEWYANELRSDMGAYGGPGNVGWLPN